jgi:N-acetylglucosamine-6-phosphate deacetylase
VKYAIVNCDIHTGECVLHDKAIVINENQIESLVEIEKVPKDLEVLDLEGVNVAPGFIDLQVNGGGGRLFTDDPSEECVSAIYSAHKRFGTTSLLPTLISTSLEKMRQAIRTAKPLVRNRRFGVLGLHIEGPYLNEARGGAHDRKFIRQISEEEFDLLLDEGKEVIRIFTVAPEAVTEQHIRKMRDRGLVVSAGHTNATYSQAMQAFHFGVNSVTHLFNAMSQLGSREPGVVGAALDDQDVWAGIIVDGFHVDPACVRLSKKLKGKRLVLVTDAMPNVGSAISSFKLGDLEVLCSEGKCVTEDGTLAGSALDMATAVRNCIQKVGIPMSEALRMASTYPAELLGVGSELGKIRPGYLANMVMFDNQLNVKGIVVEGKYEMF